MKFKPKVKHLVLFSLVGLIVALDQLTKQLVISRFRLGESISVIDGYFSLTYVRNTGAAFGILSNWDATYRIPFFIAVPLLATGVIWFIFRKVGDNDVKTAASLAAVIGGAFGNLIDRMTFGYVIDFLDFHWGVMGPHFPAFNVADIGICVGVFFLILDTYRHEETAKEVKPNAPDPV